MPRETLSKAFDALRAWPLAAVAAVLLLAVVLFDLARIDNLIWGVTKVALLAYAGYWIDRVIFPYARPHEFWWGGDPVDDARMPLLKITPLAQIRRAIIMAACILTAVLIP